MYTDLKTEIVNGKKQYVHTGTPLRYEPGPDLWSETLGMSDAARKAYLKSYKARFGGANDG